MEPVIFEFVLKTKNKESGDLKALMTNQNE